MKTKKMTFKEVRNLFFDVYPEFIAERKRNKPQSKFTTTCRCTFVDFIDSLCKDGQITEKQAFNITLKG